MCCHCDVNLSAPVCDTVLSLHVVQSLHVLTFGFSLFIQFCWWPLWVSEAFWKCMQNLSLESHRELTTQVLATQLGLFFDALMIHYAPPSARGAVRGTKVYL